jgi:hypothetical protein
VESSRERWSTGNGIEADLASDERSWRYGEVFGGLNYPHDLSHDLSERTVYIPSTSLCCYNQQRAITPLDHGVLVAESLIRTRCLQPSNKDCQE